MRVKICGLTRVADAELAVQLGADAVGFVFWPASPRSLDPAAARAIVRALPEGVMKVGVFVNQSVSFMNQVAGEAGLTHVQLHGDETPDVAAALSVPVIKAISLAGRGAVVEAWPADTVWLVDAHDPDRRGGTGTTADWAAAASLARTRRVWLAGGLTAANVEEAVRQVRPFGIDVSSGVEKAPGVKDQDRLRAFFAVVSTIAAADGGRPPSDAETAANSGTRAGGQP
jgi:phosphoribosylanthranilate isomerase